MSKTMPTTKQRINISVGKNTNWAIKQLAKRDQVPASTKVRELVERAIELEEDLIWAEIADRRSKDKNAKYVDHDTFWKKVESRF
jgi:predicted DNA-binding protein